MLSFLCNLALVVPCVAAQQPQGGDRMQPFPALEQRIGGHWLAHWCPATGTPDHVYGTGLRLDDWRGDSLEEARRQAGVALDRHGDLLQLGSSEFRESAGARMGNCYAFVYDQYFGGLPVLGGRADVRINTKGVLAMLGSTAWAVPPDLALVPAVPEATATAAAWLALAKRPSTAAQPRTRRAPRLVLWGDVDSPVKTAVALAWEVPVSNLDAEGNGPVGRYYIDARDATVLHYVSDRHECALGAHGSTPHVAPRDRQPEGLAVPAPTTVTVQAWTRTAESGIAAPTNIPLAGFTLTVPGIGARTTDANGQITIDITAPVTITVTALDGVHCQPIHPTLTAPASVTVTPGVPAVLQLFSAAATDNELAHSNAYHWTWSVNEWARSILGNSTQLAALDSVTPTVDIGSACNAFYVGNTINFYQAGTFGAVCNNTAFSSVIAHEWGHGLDDQYGGISNATVDGLSEGWGDTVAMYLLDSPNVGLDFFVPGGAPLRSGNNSTLYGTQNEVHASGESWMGFNWLVRQNLRAALGTASAVAISNSIVIGSIVANARNQPDAVTEVFLADDDDGNLLDGVPHYAALSGAAISKALPFPQQQIAVLTHAPLGDTTGQFGARAVVATSFAVTSGSISQVLLTYSENGTPPVTVPMLGNGLPNGYVALLPGIVTGHVIYHIESFHSSGYVVRSPAVGDHAYAVNLPAAGPFTSFYLEDFETVGPGWTHGRVTPTGGDDWQIGRVSGFQGTTGNVFWSDPLFPASGQRACGTSINGGGGGTAGAYPASSDYFMRSPVIDCTGRTNVSLRFKRWLTVQDAAFDQATLLVNGVTIWQNQGGANLLDTSWNLLEYVLPMADNNPTVQIEWHLKTDATLQFGGWAIDDVELGTRAQPAPPPRLLQLPEAKPAGVPLVVTLDGEPSTPLLWFAADQNSPIFVPGLGTVWLSGNILASLFAVTDATGHWSMTLNPTPWPFAVLFHSQVLTLDAAANLELSNPCSNLLLP